MAVGDPRELLRLGSTTADDTETVRNAANTDQPLGAGTFFVSGPIVVPEGNTLSGQGASLTTIQFTEPWWISLSERAHVADGEIVGVGKDATPPGSSPGVASKRGWWSVKNCIIREFPHAGINCITAIDA